jgi:hypothetical protein
MYLFIISAIHSSAINFNKLKDTLTHAPSDMDVMRGAYGDTSNAEFPVTGEPSPDIPLTLILFPEDELASCGREGTGGIRLCTWVLDEEFELCTAEGGVWEP